MRTAVGIALAAAFLAALVLVTRRETVATCDVCIEFAGRRACNTSSGPGRDEALAQAVSSACATLAGGVTEGIRCSNTPPSMVSCTP